MILVTGATGLLGNTVVRELLSRNLTVRVLVRRNTPKAAIEGLAVEVHYGELNDANAVERAVDGCSAVIHSAALIHIGWQKMEQSKQVNVEGTRKIAEACKRQSIRLVYISTVDTLPAAESITQPICESDSMLLQDSTLKPVRGVRKSACAYVVSKSTAEIVVRKMVDEGLNCIIIQPGFMLGPYDWKPSSGRMMLQVSRAPMLIAPCGGCSVCDARDVAIAVVNAITFGTSGETFITAGENMTYQRLWEHILNVAGIKKRVRMGGGIIARWGRLIDVFNSIRGFEGEVNGALIEMGNLYHYYDSSRAEACLHYRRRPLDHTLRDAWQWLSQRDVK